MQKQNKPKTSRSNKTKLKPQTFKPNLPL
jgi:hypothetical protein